MDDFQTKAWEAFQADPSMIFSREEPHNGRRLLRVAVSDRMTGKTCVSCHNTDQDSPKKDWKLGDVRAVMEVSKLIEPYLSRAEEHGRMITLAIAIPTLIIIGILFAGAALFARYNREKLQAVRNLHYLAHHDTMTGALNRNSFLHELEEAFAAEGGRRFVALHYIDLDRFKEINDKLGHNVGDELIRSAAGRLQALAGDGDLVCRLGVMSSRLPRRGSASRPTPMPRRNELSRQWPRHSSSNTIYCRSPQALERHMWLPPVRRRTRYSRTPTSRFTRQRMRGVTAT
jgi:hypothetical protein